jgi:toxin-antitoxin system PIN domain toxin
MILQRLRYLPDVNVLLALTDMSHTHHAKATDWFNSAGRHDWGMCSLTESGFLRLTTNPRVGARSVAEASQALAILIGHPGYRFWPIQENWTTLAAPFVERVFGHQQITDSYLLGLAVKEGGILVTADKALRYLAGPKYGSHVLLLE